MAERLWEDGQLIQEGEHLIFYKYGPHFYGRENEFNACSHERFVSLMQQRFGPDWQPRGSSVKGYVAPVAPAVKPELNPGLTEEPGIADYEADQKIPAREDPEEVPEPVAKKGGFPVAPDPAPAANFEEPTPKDDLEDLLNG